MKFTIGNRSWHFVLKFLFVVCLIMAPGCGSDDDEEETGLGHRIILWNKTSDNVTVLLLPGGLPIKYVDDNNYFSTAEYEPGSIEPCYYYYSKKKGSDNKHRFFSFSTKLSIYIFDSNIYHNYSHKVLLQESQYQLAYLQVTKKELDSSGGFFTLEHNGNNYSLILDK